MIYRSMASLLARTYAWSIWHTLLVCHGMAHTLSQELNDDEVEGFLFDIDGTLVDTMPHFYPSWIVACEQHGLTITEDEFYGFSGLPLPVIVAKLWQAQKGGDPPTGFIELFLKTKVDAHHEHEARVGPPPAIECIARLAREAEARGLPIAAATSGLREHVEVHLAHVGLDSLFSQSRGNLVFAADVSRGKPAPDIFQEAARRIGVPPHRCRAFEDGEAGLLAAFRAGCHVIDVTWCEEYPIVEGLRKAKSVQEGSREWT